MNKLFTFLASAALIGSLSACSSDEPANGGGIDVPKDGTMYLTVNITDASSIGRANEGDLVPSLIENNVATAHFFFFDDKGIYVAQADVWNDGSNVDQDSHNVEYIGKNLLVLKGLTQQHLPKYVMTVLNAPSTLANEMVVGTTTMDQLRAKQLDYANGGNFIMTTSSFLGGEATLYDDARYYANVIPETYLLTEPVDLKDTTIPALTIYVERLAAKYTLDLQNGDSFNVTMTVAGDLNDNDLSTDIGDTELKVTITGFGVTATEPTSYLSKNLDGFTATSFNDTKWNTLNGGWNAANFHRSFWGKSVQYGTIPTLSSSTFYASKNNGITGPAYSNENTNTVANLSGANITVGTTTAPKLIADRVTNVVFTAVVTDKNGGALDLVKYNGVLYKNDNFMQYILARTAATEGLNYYILTAKKGETTTTKDPETGVETTTTHTENIYRQVGPEDFIYYQTEGRTSLMGVKFNADATTLYEFDDSKPAGEKYSVIEDGVAKLNAALANRFANKNWAERYNGGATVYTIPVEHLLGQNKGGVNKPFTLTEGEGEYGVVRNHWYQINITSISKLGKGVFNPNKGQDEEDNTDIITPDPDPDPKTYGMAANVKILSWKIVKQDVDL